MQLGALGPLAVQLDGEPVALAAAKPRALLLRLLVARGRPVPAERLIEDLWDGDPPRSAAQTLQSYVSQLRKVLGHDRVRTAAGGYELVLEGAHIDVDEFEAAVGRGRAALTAGDLTRAVDDLHAARSLWRGEPFADAAGAPWAAADIARLDELYLSALDALFEAELGLGRHADVVAEAEAAVAEHPLRERLWAHLIMALYRQGRQAEALRAFQRLRELLAEELGIDPSPELRALEQAVLEQDATLERPVTATTSPALPSGLVTFVLTDVVGSTRLWEVARDQMPDALALHDDAIRSAVVQHGGVLLKARGEGDSTFSVFRRATDAAAAALAAQTSLRNAAWPADCALSVRVSIHTGEALEHDGDYYGPTVNRAARLRVGKGSSESSLVGLGSLHLAPGGLSRPRVPLEETSRGQLTIERPRLVGVLPDQRPDRHYAMCSADSARSLQSASC